MTTICFDAEMDFQQTDTSPPRSFEIKVRSLEITPQDMASVQIADGISNDYAYIQAALDAVDEENRLFRVPPSGGLWQVGGTLGAPDDRVLLIQDRLIGLTDTGIFQMRSSELIFEGYGAFRNLQLQLTGGSPRVRDFRYTGFVFTHAILANTTDAVYEDIEIDGLWIKEANYGFVRRGGSLVDSTPVLNGSTLRGCRVARGHFYDLSADAVVFDLCPNDSGIVIENHIIDLVDAGADPGGARPNWGMGVSLSGVDYDENFANENMIKDVVVNNIRGSRLRRLVHAEAAAGLKISQVHGFGMSTDYSPDSGLEAATIGIYGSRDITINGVTSDGDVEVAGIHLKYGDGVPCRDFNISNVDLEQGNLIIEQGFNTARNELSSIKVRNGSVVVTGRAGELIMNNVRAQRPLATGVAMTLAMNGAEPWNAAIRSKLDLIGCDARDENDVLSRTLSISSVTVVKFDGLFESTVTWDPASLATGAQQTRVVTVTGAKVGDIVEVSFSLALSGTRIWGEVTAADTVTVYQRNDTGAAVDIGSGSLKVKLRRV